MPFANFPEAFQVVEKVHCNVHKRKLLQDSTLDLNPKHQITHLTPLAAAAQHPCSRRQANEEQVTCWRHAEAMSFRNQNCFSPNLFPSLIVSSSNFPSSSLMKYRGKQCPVSQSCQAQLSSVFPSVFHATCILALMTALFSQLFKSRLKKYQDKDAVIWNVGSWLIIRHPINSAIDETASSTHHCCNVHTQSSHIPVLGQNGCILRSAPRTTFMKA